VHPESFTFKLPANVSFGEAAMAEPLAVGVHAATKARIKPGDNAVVMGAGPIGLVTALSALAAGCAQVFVTDLAEKKLEIAGSLSRAILPINVSSESLTDKVMRATDGWGVDVVFEATGSRQAAKTVFETLAPGGCVVMIGGQSDPVQYDAGAAMVREARVENIFRYAHVFPRCVGMLSSGAIDVKPLITKTFEFKDSVQAFELAASAPPADVKMQIELPQ
jgi:D-xylulose reductase